jgi:intron-binding protein aquarius
MIDRLYSSGFLINYLWKFFSDDVSSEHLLSVLACFNVEHRTSLIEALISDEKKFSLLVDMSIDWFLDSVQTSSLNYSFLSRFIMFLDSCAQSVHVKGVRNSFLRYLSLPIWQSLSKSRLQAEFENDSTLENAWKKLMHHRNDLTKAQGKQLEVVEDTPKKKGKRSSKRKLEDIEESSETTGAVKIFNRDSQFIPSMISFFLKQLDACENDKPDSEIVSYLLRNCELFVDLLCQYPTRRFLIVFLDDQHFILKSKISSLFSSNKLFASLVDLLEHYLSYPVNNKTERLIPLEDLTETRNEYLRSVQQFSFSSDLLKTKLRDLVFSSLGQLSKRDQLLKHFQLLNDDELRGIAKHLKLIDDEGVKELSAALIKEILLNKLCKKPQLVDHYQQISLYPTEEDLWNEAVLPFSSTLSSATVLPLPKLTLQFLSIEDYLYRSFLSFRAESYYSVREDLLDAISRTAPKKQYNGSIIFNGWSRYALPLLAVSIDEIGKPAFGEIIPSRISATLQYDISRYGEQIREEWESFREHDVVFLISFDSPALDFTGKLDEYEKAKKILEIGGKLESLKGSFKEEEMRNFLVNYGRLLLPVVLVVS